MPVYVSNFNMQMVITFHLINLTSEKLAPNGPANGPAVRFSKIKNRS